MEGSARVDAAIRRPPLRGLLPVYDPAHEQVVTPQDSRRVSRRTRSSEGPVTFALGSMLGAARTQARDDVRAGGCLCGRSGRSRRRPGSCRSINVPCVRPAERGGEPTAAIQTQPTVRWRRLRKPCARRRASRFRNCRRTGTSRIDWPTSTRLSNDFAADVRATECLDWRNMRHREPSPTNYGKMRECRKIIIDVRKLFPASFFCRDLFLSSTCTDSDAVGENILMSMLMR